MDRDTDSVKLPGAAPASPLTAQSLHAFLGMLAARTPTPGGGSVAALTGAMAAAQAAMAVAYTLGKAPAGQVKAIPQHAGRGDASEAELRAQDQRLRAAAARLEALIEQDRQAYESLNILLKVPVAARPARQLATAVNRAIEVPQTVAQAALDVLQMCQALREKVKPALASDLHIAAILAWAAVEASVLNILVNVPLLADPQLKEQWDRQAAAYRLQAHAGLDPWRPDGASPAPPP